MKYHEPVMLKEVVEGLRLTTGGSGKIIDATLGDGGHTLEFLKMGYEVLGLDVSQSSIDNAMVRIKEEGFDGRFRSVKTNFKNIEQVATENNFGQVNGILFDLGYSSSQLEEDDLGLSFTRDQPLDMRLSSELGVTAADLVNALAEKDLAKMFFELSDEKFSGRFAHAIVEARKLKKIQTTKQLADLLRSVVSSGYEHGRIHPATRVFQALRIAVNGEFENLEVSLPRAARLLLPEARMVVISFHSLEDRLVKEFGRSVPPELKIKEIGKKPIVPSETEVSLNTRSRSAKIRIFEKNE